MAPPRRCLAAALGLTIGLAAAATAALGQPPPKPKPKPPTESAPEQEEPARQARPKNFAPPVAPPPPPPNLLLTADMDCVVELDGEVLGELEKDVVQSFRITEGEHLLQAFPLEVEGPTWKETVKGPETGQVTALIELRAIVDEWNEEQQNLDRFRVQDRVVLDTDSGLLWTRNVAPEMRWDDIVGYCARQEIEGLAGWRLPTIDELSKLYFPDHEAPRQETSRGEAQWTILGKRKGEMEVLPRLIFEPFDHNSVGALWVRGSEERVMCGFLGEFNCSVGRKKTTASALCVREGG